MNLKLNVAGLVLAGVTGWVVLALGALPVKVLRLLRSQPLAAAGAWIIVAALAPSLVFHWYVIFAVLCFIAWTKLDRLGGKIMLAITAALSLSLGLIFPLQVSAPLLTQEHPYALASLYLGSGAAGLAYVLFLTSARTVEGWRPSGLARNLILVSMAWTVLLALRPWLAAHFSIVPPQQFSSAAASFAGGGAECGLGIVLIILAILAFVAVRRGALLQARMYALGAIPVALAQDFLAQLVFC